MRATFVFIIFGLVLFAFYYFYALGDISAQTGSSDAIAIRVIPNPDHSSARNWYRERGFGGSPQSLTVDGYEAVRDGRTVYVNVANVSGSNLFTNIYLISYNQQAEGATMDIFSNILSHWKFNTNLNSLGSCRDNPDLACRSDDDCSIGDVCGSPKARLVRDTQRLADLDEMRIQLRDYYKENGHYPKLSAGSYVKNGSLSVWPSWNDQFRQELGFKLPVDPVNRIGDCPGYNSTTCWDEDTHSFVSDDLSDLPDNSLVYVYTTDDAGSDYDLYAVFESGFTVVGPSPVPPNFPGVCLDNDEDGYGSPASPLCVYSELDCNDNDEDVTTGSPENTADACGDNIDNDCDGLVDCADGDCAGIGPCVSSICNNNGVCEPGLGETCSNCAADGCCPVFVCGDGICSEPEECPAGSSPCPDDCFCGNNSTECGEECDDGNTVSGDGCSDSCHIEIIECHDDDSDGYGVCPDCGTANGCLYDGDDCDDSSPSINPGENEVCDGLDNDCNGLVDDTLSAEECGFVCTDMGYDYNAARSGDLRCCGNDPNEGDPYEASEVSCSDGNDNDCDGLIDISGGDPDCTGVCNNTGEDDWINAATPGDCNQCDFNGDQDGDQPDSGWSSYPARVDECDSDCGIVANTISFSEFEPGGETSCDGLDNDCDGTVDNIASPPLCSLQEGVCSGATQVCGGSSGWQACGSAEYGPDYEITETTCDGLDNDCDGSVDEDGVCCVDDDDDGYFGVGPQCPSGDDCDDTRDWINPGAAETCDTFDNNCSDPDHSDGVNAADIDEGCDDDSDGYCDDSMQIYNNTSMCPNTVFTEDGMWGDDCDDSETTTNPGESEVCGDGIDNNCNGNIDEGCVSVTCYRDSDSDGYGDPSNSTTAASCDSGWVLDDTDCDDNEPAINPGAGEICDDGLDNDCDSDVDCDDGDCASDPNCAGCAFPATLPCTFP